MIHAVVACAVLVASSAGEPAAGAASNLEAKVPIPDGLFAVFHTAHGAITAQLFPADVPLTVANFVGLAEGTIAFDAPGREPGKPFYDGLTFHRVVPGFVVQGGDPLGNGEGGPGYEFADEFTPRLKHAGAGMLAMANSGPNTNGSQFYFTLGPVQRLNYKHTVFGRVVRGLEVLPRLEKGDAMQRVEIVRVGAAAEAFRPDREMLARLVDATPRIAPRDPALSPFFEDTAGLELPEWLPAWLNEKLHHYAVVSGVTIRVRTLPKFSAPPGDAETRNPLRHLHELLAGDDPRAATLVYVADEKRWRLWLADGLLPQLGLAPETAGSEAGAKQLHEFKQQILADAKTQMEQGIARRSVDAAITNLIEALDAGALRRAPSG